MSPVKIKRPEGRDTGILCLPSGLLESVYCRGERPFAPTTEPSVTVFQVSGVRSQQSVVGAVREPPLLLTIDS